MSLDPNGIDYQMQSRVGVMALTICYVMIEVVLNHTLYTQLSTNSNFFTIGALELWGKIITGLGLGLVLTRLYASLDSMGHSQEDKGGFDKTFKIFVAICLVTIPLSFWLQNTITSKIVSHSTEEQRNRAIIALAAKSTLVPHYDFSMASYPTDNLGFNTFDKLTYPIRDRAKTASPEYINYESAFIPIANNCMSGSEKVLNTHSGIDKTFFALGALKIPGNEQLYKSLITDYYECLYQDDGYRIAHSSNKKPSMNAVKVVFQGEYRKASNEYKKYEDRIKPHRGPDQRIRLETEWNKRMSEFLGFKSTLKPMLRWEQFIREPDVIRYYRNAVGDENAMYPYAPDYTERVLEIVTSSLPNSVIPGYRGADGKLSSDISDKEALVQGEAAYKAIVMPIVGLSLSAFFLVFNAVIIICSLSVRRLAKPVAAVVVIITLSWFVFYPSMSLGAHHSAKPYLANQGVVAKWVYYHERNIAWLYNKLG